MVGTPAQKNPEAPTQQALHPMVTGGGSPPISMPMQSLSRIPSPKLKENIVKISNFSLLSIVFSLMFLGALTFLGGLLLGMWISGSYTPSMPMAQGGYPSPYYYSPPQEEAPRLSHLVPEQSGILQAVGQELGETTSSALSSKRIPGVPTALSPITSTAQSLEARQVGRKAQEEFGRLTSRPSHGEVQPYNRPQYSRLPQSSRPPSPLPSRPSANLKTSSYLGGESSQSPPSPLSENTKSLKHEAKAEHTVQLGVFVSKENAEALVNRLQTLNYTSHIQEGKAPDGSEAYYVFSGYYKDYQTAAEAASHFTSQGIPGAIVVSIPANQKHVS